MQLAAVLLLGDALRGHVTILVDDARVGAPLQQQPRRARRPRLLGLKRSQVVKRRPSNIAPRVDVRARR